MKKEQDSETFELFTFSILEQYRNYVKEIEGGNKMIDDYIDYDDRYFGICKTCNKLKHYANFDDNYNAHNQRECEDCYIPSKREMAMIKGEAEYEDSKNDYLAKLEY